MDAGDQRADDLCGASIEVRGESWIVARQVRYQDCQLLGLAGAGNGNAGATREVLTPFDRPRRKDAPAAIRVLRPRRWVHALRSAASHAVPPFGGLPVGAIGSIDLLPYQLEPALALFRHGITRLLIADGVGLGKTIQAGLIVSAIAARFDESRALIVVPAGLRDQWSCELARHFGIAAVAADAAWMARTARELPPDLNPWALAGTYIASIDFIKQPEVLRALEDLAWDVVVVDEAHAVGVGTARRHAAHGVASRSRAVLLLTATPHSGDAAQFEGLCRLGSLRGDTRATLFCRSRAALAGVPRRRTAIVRVMPTPFECRMHRLLGRYAALVWKEAGARHDTSARLAVIVLRKRALSSAASLLASVTRRADLLAHRARETADPHQLLLPIDAEDPLPDAEPEDVLAAPGLTDSDRELRFLHRLADKAREAAATESKIRFLLRLVSRVAEPMIVFTEYRDTLARLAGQLACAGRPLVLMHGALSLQERAAAQRAFNADGGILLATDAASEGLNLQSRCRIVIHFELPWNPARLEQRAGRVDRIGQSRRVHEVALVADDTAEEFVLAPLARRAAGARSAGAGETSAFALIAESAVADAILDRTPLSCAAAGAPAHIPKPPGSLSAEAVLEAQRLARWRGWLESAGRPSPGNAIAVTTLGRARQTAAAVCIYRLRLSTEGRLLHEELVAVRHAHRHSVPARVEDARAAARDLVDSDPAVGAAVLAQLAPEIDAVVERVRAWGDGQAAADRIVAARFRDRLKPLLQPALFDDRALREREAARSQIALTTDYLERRLAAAETRGEITRRLELVAILFGAGASST